MCRSLTLAVSPSPLVAPVWRSRRWMRNMPSDPEAGRGKLARCVPPVDDMLVKLPSVKLPSSGERSVPTPGFGAASLGGESVQTHVGRDE